MRCAICDRALSDAEVQWNKDTETFEPCSTCLEIALDAAYSGGFDPDGEPLDDPDMQNDYGNGAVETLDPDFQHDDQRGDFTDIHYFGGVDDDYA